MKEEILKALDFRYAVKKFDSSKKINPSDLEVLKEALRKSPSSLGIQPWKFLIIEDEDIRKRLREVGDNQGQITDSSHLFVLCVKKEINGKDVAHYMDTISKIRKIPVEDLKKFSDEIHKFTKERTKEEMLEWSKRQVYIALGFLLEAAALMKIDACPMEGFDSKGFDRILALETEGYTSAVLCAVGYRSKEDTRSKKKKVRFPEKEVFEEI